MLIFKIIAVISLIFKIFFLFLQRGPTDVEQPDISTPSASDDPWGQSSENGK